MIFSLCHSCTAIVTQVLAQLEFTSVQPIAKLEFTSAQPITINLGATTTKKMAVTRVATRITTFIGRGVASDCNLHVSFHQRLVQKLGCKFLVCLYHCLSRENRIVCVLLSSSLHMIIVLAVIKGWFLGH